MLSANYGENFYKGTNAEDVLLLWSVQFADDDPEEVMQAVQNCIATLSWKPNIADIRKRMAGNVMKGQMTPTEAFQQISIAVSKSYDRESAAKQFNALSPILRKTVGTPAQLISWNNVSDEAFQTVIMSAIRESYKEFAQREADYHALPNFAKQDEQWRINAPENVALPEPEIAKSVDEIIAESNQKAAEYGMQMTPELARKHADGVAAFLKPMTDDEIKMVEAREEAKSMRFMKC